MVGGPRGRLAAQCGAGASCSSGRCRLPPFLLPTPPAAPLPAPQSPAGPTAIQLISVTPEQLTKHAEANSCGVAVLPPGALALPPGATHDAAVAAVVAAVEAQWYRDLLGTRPWFDLRLVRLLCLQRRRAGGRQAARAGEALAGGRASKPHRRGRRGVS